MYLLPIGFCLALFKLTDHQGYFIIIFSSLFFWGLVVCIAAIRKGLREACRLHSVKIIVNDGDEPALVETHRNIEVVATFTYHNAFQLL
jgi:hypothetical protein